ncbi:MAG: glutamine--fructose-6-phosphate transaminase (isomerizing) [Myxococcota bacterium]
MCGIVGFVGSEACVDILVEGLRKLEYRGYDSAGVAVVERGELALRRAEGKLDNLVRKIRAEPLDGTTGVGHTRWATHGAPTEDNAHPHRAGSVAVVHNGIIENHVQLKRELPQRGPVFKSETDTEVIAHLIEHYRKREGLGLVEATRRATLRLHGAYAIVVVDASEPDVIVGVRIASPLVVGIAADASFLASDVSAILAHTRDIVFLDEGQLAAVRAPKDGQSGVEIRDVATNAIVPVVSTHITWTPAMAEKGGFKHFMLKEIHEQPRAVADTLRGRISLERATVELPEVPFTAADLQSLSQLYIVACGTSWHAGLVGRYLFEDLAGLASHVELASELRYRNAPIDKNTLVIAISQSGETADTLAAIREAKKKGARVLAVVNVIGSSIAREAHGVVYTHAGPEIGVASTKAFTTQLVAMHLLALRFGELLGRLSESERRAEFEALMHAPTLLEKTLQHAEPYRAVAERWHEVHSMLFLGRGNLYPLALEGALKLKEISYIHAEGQAAGEIKHGPIALIDRHVPTVVLNPQDPHFAKVRSNLSEVRARSGPVLIIATEGDREAYDLADFVLEIPAVTPHLLPLVAAIPLQLLAYTFADFKGTDVDQPRNLAKSVTVE